MNSGQLLMHCNEVFIKHVLPILLSPERPKFEVSVLSITKSSSAPISIVSATPAPPGPNGPSGLNTKIILLYI